MDSDSQRGDIPTSPPSSRQRLWGLCALALVLLALPGLLSLPAVQTRLAAIGATDARPEFLEMSLVNPGGVTGFVSANRANVVRFQVVNRYRSTETVTWQVALAPDTGGSHMLRERALRLSSGQSQFETYSGRVPCDSRSRVVITARVNNDPPVKIAFHVFSYRSHGSLICTSNPDVEQS